MMFTKKKPRRDVECEVSTDRNSHLNPHSKLQSSLSESWDSHLDPSMSSLDSEDSPRASGPEVSLQFPQKTLYSEDLTGSLSPASIHKRGLSQDWNSHFNFSMYDDDDDDELKNEIIVDWSIQKNAEPQVDPSSPSRLFSNHPDDSNAHIGKKMSKILVKGLSTPRLMLSPKRQSSSEKNAEPQVDPSLPSRLFSNHPDDSNAHIGKKMSKILVKGLSTPRLMLAPKRKSSSGKANSNQKRMTSEEQLMMVCKELEKAFFQE